VVFSDQATALSAREQFNVRPYQAINQPTNGSFAPWLPRDLMHTLAHSHTLHTRKPLIEGNIGRSIDSLTN